MHKTMRRGASMLFILSLLVGSLVIFWISQCFHLDSSLLKLEYANEYNSGWSIQAANSAYPLQAVPRSLTVENENIILINTLPEFHCSNHALCFRTNNEKVRVTVSDETIYTYGYNDDTPFGHYFGMIWNMIPLREDMCGKRIAIELTALDDEQSDDNYSFYLDNRNTIIGTLLLNTLPLLCNTLICMVAGILIIGSGLLHLRAGVGTARAHIYLGIFILLTQLYVFSDAGFLQFFIDNKAVSYYIVHLSLMLMPAPFTLYLAELFPFWRKEYRALCMVFCAYFLLRTALYVAGLAELTDLLSLTHALILLGLTSAAVLCLSESKSPMSRIMLVGIIVFSLFVFFTVAVYYWIPHLESKKPLYTLILSIGIDILMICFYSAMLKSTLNTATHAMIYQHQAYTDALTQVNNRAAFTSIEKQLDPQACPALTLIMIDLNNLKLVNDTLGHPAGDKLICTLVQCLKIAFEGVGKIYRYGGDEFIVLAEDAPMNDVIAARSYLDQLLNDHRRHGGQEVSVAVGMASRQDGQHQHLSVAELLHLADMMMYQIKAEQKAAPASDRVVRHHKLEQIDSITGILTFAAFKTNVYNALAEGDVRFPCIVTFDLNFFDGYNNLFGWEAGNRLLLKLTSMALSLCGEKGFCAHGDADTFWVFADAPDLNVLTDRITHEARRFQQHLEDCLLFPSFGIYCINERMLPVSDMCSRATSAKKRIKGHLDVLYTVYSTQEHQRRIDNMRLTAYMQKGLDGEEFIPYYQPKFHAASGRLQGAEALARWSHTPGESTSPGEFTALFEKSGLILKLDWYMLEKTCQLLRRLLDEGYACVPISNNFSRLHLFEADCAQRLIGMVDAYRIPHELIEIELTETALVQDTGRTLDLINALQAAGFAVSLDDFGSGVSSLGSLNSVRVDTIKIDRSLICAADAPADNDIFEFVVSLCKHLGIQPLAEGVETKEQLTRVKRSGCELIQGNYYSAPLSQNDFKSLLQKG